MAYAAAHGHMDIVLLMLQRGAKDYDEAMDSAAEHGHADIVDLMLKAGATAYDRAIDSAVGHREVVELIKRWRARNS
jgi:ankyrin repeat protein